MASLPNMSGGPHVPTLVYALVGAVILLALYHMVRGHRR